MEIKEGGILQKWMFILWPASIGAGTAVGVFFTLVEPRELYLLGEPVHYDPIATYAIGFIAFWLLCAGSSYLTWSLMKSSTEGPSQRNEAEEF